MALANFLPPTLQRLTAFAALALLLLGPALLSAQQIVQGPGGRSYKIVDGKPVPVDGQPMDQPPQNQPSGEAKPDKKEDGKDDKDKDENDEKKEGKEDSSVVKRPDKPPRTPDPRELDAKPDKNGRVPFNFHGQPWPEVLQWLANVSNYSLDWQELPSDYLNLTTQRTYTLPEARDLLNRHLQARGYVLLLSGEVLSVFKLDNLDPSLVPTVTELDLYDRQPHDLVKVAFELPASIEVAKAVEDFKQVLSKNAKLMPLAATNRVLAIDAVANLRLVSKLLNEERLEAEGREIPQRFVLKHARAEKVINTLYVVLGLDPAAQPSQMELQIQMQKMQLLQQMQQKGKDVGRMLNKDGPKVYLAFNRQENSILANAEPEQMKIIERTIGMLDIPAAGSAAAVAAKQADVPTGPVKRFAKTYELENIKPESLMVTLEEIGDLDPLTELRSDSKAKILFVRASQLDHDKVQDIIDQLDTGGQVFEVFELRYHPADGVAGTVLALLGKKEKKKENNQPWYFFSSRNNNEEEEEPDMELRVDADVDNNRLLVRGPQEEVDKVRELLVKIGELGAGNQAGGQTMRVIDSLDPNTTQKLLEQLRTAWPSIGGGAELIIEAPDEPAEEAKSKAPKGAPAGQTTQVMLPRASARLGGRVFLVSDGPDSDGADIGGEDASDGADAPEAPAATPDSDNKKSPVAVTVTPDGRLVLMSDDPAAVARLEDLIATLTPREALFKEFPVEHADANYIHWKLEDYFEDELAGDDSGQILDWFGRVRDTGNKDASAKLSKRRKLRLILNVQTNSIVAANATSQQLETIQRLIDTWDQPPRATDVINRRTGIVKVKYSSATKIAASLKEVYRDLLSSRDKEFDTGEEKGGGGYALPKTTEIEFAGVDASGEPTSRTNPIQVRFDGALSIGVDEASDMLLISAHTELYDGVVNMIHLLDEEAKPNNTIHVRRVTASAEAVKEALSNTFGTVWVGGQPDKPNAQPNQYQNRNDRNDRRDRDNDRRRRGR